jgi:hypothetical protein
MNYEVVPTKVLHIKALAEKLRTAACLGLDRYGIDPRRALLDAFRKSRTCCTALIDGKPEAIWGVQAPLLSDFALVWLAMSNDVTRFPKAIVAEAKLQIGEMGKDYAELATTVLPDDRQSIAFAAFLGFHDRHDEGRKMSRKMIEADLRDNPRHRVAIGDKYVIALGWHGGN